MCPLKAVSDISHGLDKTVAGVFYFAPESSDVNVDGSISAEVIMTPDAVEQSVTRKDTAGITRQELEQLVLFESQYFRTTGYGNLAPADVNRQVATSDKLCIAPVTAVEESLDPYNQFLRVIRFDNEIIHFELAIKAADGFQAG